MIFKIVSIGLCLIIVGLIIVFGFIIFDFRKGRYDVKDSFLAKEAEERYGIMYPEKTISELKDEIEKVAELLISGEESNRYTELLKQKAQNDIRIREINNAVIENVELVKYVDDVLKARIKYKDYNFRYTLILSLCTVTSGRVFLNDYFVFKNKI